MCLCVGKYVCVGMYMCVCVFVCVEVNQMGSCPAQPVYLTTRLLDRLSPLRGKPVLCTFCPS